MNYFENEIKNILKRKEFIFVAILCAITTGIDIVYAHFFAVGMLTFAFGGILFSIGSIMWLVFSKNFKEISLRIALIVLLGLMLGLDISFIYVRNVLRNDTRSRSLD